MLEVFKKGCVRWTRVVDGGLCAAALCGEKTLRADYLLALQSTLVPGPSVSVRYMIPLSQGKAPCHLAWLPAYSPCQLRAKQSHIICNAARFELAELFQT